LSSILQTKTTEEIAFARTRKSHRYEFVIPSNSIIHNIRKINDLYSSFTTPSIVDKKTNMEIEMYCDTNRLNEVITLEDDINNNIAC